MTHKQVDKNLVMPITKANPHQNIIQMKGGVAYLQDCQKIQYLTHLQDLQRIQYQTPQVPSVIIKARHDHADSSVAKSISEFESPQENGEQIIVKYNKLLATIYSRISKLQS